VHVTVIGSSPAWPNPGGAHAGVLVEGSSRLLLDCGPGVLPRLRAGAVDGGWPRVDGIAITHFHLDHWGDLVPWVWALMFGLGGDAPVLWLPPRGREHLRHFGAAFGYEGMFERAFHVEEYAERTPFAVGDLEVTPYRVPHYSLETYALRVSGDGRTLCYSGDSGPCAELAEAATDADLFLCEATLETGARDGDLRGHLSADEAVAIFRRSGARRLLLTHRPAELPVPEGLELAYDGLVVEL
jgi:ribonuclease BN (tRNA processing enzyme)